jgi:hypothetical protein
MKARIFSRVTAVVCAWAWLALAQDTATLTGTVTDPSGAVIAGAEVVVTNVATGMTARAETNAEGIYRVPFLRPGTYRVTITAAGFKRFVRDNVTLSVGSTVPVNATLEIGTVADVIEVTASVPLLETETSSTGTLVTGEYFYRMPLYQRHVRSILYLTPGVNVAGFGWGGSLGGFQINGESSDRIGFFEDGMYGVQPTGGNTTDTIQNTIAEIKVLTTALPAEYGHSAGGAIVVVKKTGTNEFHGLLSELFRVDAMQHRRFFQLETFKQTGTHLLFMQPDANVSGPVLIPKLYDGRNRTFFLFAWQKLIEKQSQQRIYTVPTPEELNGDFSYAGSGVAPYPIFDPRTTRLVDGQWFRDPFPGNIIPKASWDPVARNILAQNIWVAPNRRGTATPTGYVDNFMAMPYKKVFWNNYSLRLDHQFTPGFRMFYNLSYNDRWERLPDLSILNPAFDATLRATKNRWTTTGIGTTYTFSPTLISETRLTYFRYKAYTPSPAYGKDWAKLFGIPNVEAGSMPQITGVPYVANPAMDVQEHFHFRTDLSKLSGRHAFKTGYDLLRVRRNNYTVTNNAGVFTLAPTTGIYANGATIPNTGGNDLTRLLVGAVSSAAFTVNLLSNLPRNWIHALYFQDDWKVLPRLTLNLGVRWQVQSVMNNKYGQQSSFDPLAPDNVVPGARGVITHPKKLHNKDWNNFQPRLGMAWQVSPKLVVRSGFAIATVDERLPVPPTEEYGSITARIDTPSGDYRPRFQLSAGPPLPLPWPQIRPDGTIPFQGANYGARSASWVDPNRKLPYAMNWNFNIQYNFSANYLLELMYTGDRGVNGFESMQINHVPFDWAWNIRQTDPALFSRMEGNPQAYRPFPNFGTINFLTNGANSVYHAGTIKLEKRYSRGLSFLTYYTYSRAINSSTSNQLIPRRLDRGRADFDRTHQYTVSMNYELPFGKGRRWLNRGGIWNAIFGGYDMVFIYRIASGNPLTFTYAGSPYRYMPTTLVAYRTNRPNSTGQRAHLRKGWSDLGPDRWTRANQNKMIVSMDYFRYPDPYTFGNVGRNTMDRQRFIDHEFSASKEWKIRERVRLQLRYDFQNPFKWYNLGPPDTTVNFTNPSIFGTILPSTGNEGTTASGGGQPLQNITLAIRW